MGVEAIENRDKGAAPLSIGTSLALESLCGFGEFEDQKGNLTKVDELRVNLRTLVRNFLGSIDKYVKETTTVSNMLDYLIEDIIVLKSVIESKSDGRVKLSIYYPTYTDNGFKRKFPNAIRKIAKTAKQKLDSALEEDLLKAIYSKREATDVENFHLVDFDDNYKGGNVCLISHYPVDLLSSKNYKKLYLLESHSGAFKDKTKWYTKLTNGKKLLTIPFNKFTIQVLGDGNTMFSAMKISLKEPLFLLADAKGWTNVTTFDKVRFDVNRMEDSEIKTLYKSLV